MADPRVTGGAGCDDRCGCPVPCPGGTACRCTARATEGGDTGFTHKRCSCGMHCSCNPCECGDSAGSATVGSCCTCGSGCSCGTCKSSGVA